MTSPANQYQQLIDSHRLLPDPAQQQAILVLERIYQQLLHKRGLHFKWLRQPTPVRGVYLWGSVGAGKTMLMDLFYNALPENGKIRLHFHRFMQEVHALLRQFQGQKNPLLRVAKDFAIRADVLCFDEFIVNDIGDAMLLSGLLQAMLAEGITLITTSNCEPCDLYRYGLQRARFLPTITLLEQHTAILQVLSARDYRLRNLPLLKTYLYPCDDSNLRLLASLFEKIAGDIGQTSVTLIINSRPIVARQVAQGVVWFDFHTLCHTPRSQLDYIEIARLFHTVFISHIPILTPQDRDSARYLINLIDVLYDAQSKVVIAATAPMHEIYQAGELHFEFRRTQSRLNEMQSEAYWQKPHL